MGLLILLENKDWIRSRISPHFGRSRYLALTEIFVQYFYRIQENPCGRRGLDWIV